MKLLMVLWFGLHVCLCLFLCYIYACFYVTSMGHSLYVVSRCLQGTLSHNPPPTCPTELPSTLGHASLQAGVVVVHSVIGLFFAELIAG
jgi:hypothetical protein